MGQVAVMDAGREGARQAEESAGGGRSLKTKIASFRQVLVQRSNGGA